MPTARSFSPDRTLLLAGDNREAIAAHAHREYPNECCGALLGSTQQSGERTVTAVLPIQNAAHPSARRTGYALHADGHLLAEKSARARNLEVVGVYHSHPNGPATPSERDRAEAMPYWSYLIVGCDAQTLTSIRCWRLRADGSCFDEEAVQTEI